jgi:hypothetical protein
MRADGVRGGGRALRCGTIDDERSELHVTNPVDIPRAAT